MHASRVPKIVCALKPKTAVIGVPLELIGNNTEDLKEWKLCDMTRVMRSTRVMTDLSYDGQGSHALQNSSSVNGIKPVFIMINSWMAEDQIIGISKAVELIQKKKEKKFVILTEVRLRYAIPLYIFLNTVLLYRSV